MNIFNCIFIFLTLVSISDGFTVKGSSGPLVVHLGGSVVLPCFIDPQLLKKELKVEWRRTDSETLVHLFQDGESRPETQQQDYHDRAHFFTEEIQHGNFSLLLNNVRAEDKGEYRCTVHSEQDSAETVVEIKDVERLIVSGSNHSISAYAGEDVTLSCSVDSHIPPEEIEEVSWKKTDEDENMLVLLFQNNETISDSADERYRDRAEFFTDEIPKGNFSLRLKSVRTEDKGVYMCEVTAGGFSANATVVLQRLGFSSLHIMVLILCISASGSALLLYSLICCRSQNKDRTARKHFRTLGSFHAFLPNIILFFAFALWGITEGNQYETVSCCALHILRPLMLIWTAPYLKDFPDIFRKWIKSSVLHLELAAFGIIYNSVFFRRTWERILLHEETDRVGVICLFGALVLLCVFCISRQLIKLRDQEISWVGGIHKWMCAKLEYLAIMGFMYVISFQFILLFFAFGLTVREYVGPGAFQVLFFLSISCLNGIRKREKCCLHLLDKTLWTILMILMNAALVGFYFTSMKNETDRAGWACTALFQQTVWIIIFYMELNADLGKLICFDPAMNHSPVRNLQDSVTENQANHSSDYITVDFSSTVPVYLIGSVGLILLNSVVLITELILTTVNGKRAVGDLRIIVFSAESFFATSVLILHVFAPWIPIRTSMKRS